MTKLLIFPEDAVFGWKCCEVVNVFTKAVRPLPAKPETSVVLLPCAVVEWRSTQRRHSLPLCRTRFTCCSPTD